MNYSVFADTVGVFGGRIRLAGVFLACVGVILLIFGAPHVASAICLSNGVTLAIAGNYLAELVRKHSPSDPPGF